MCIDCVRDGRGSPSEARAVLQDIGLAIAAADQLSFVTRSLSLMTGQHLTCRETVLILINAAAENLLDSPLCTLRREGE